MAPCALFSMRRNEGVCLVFMVTLAMIQVKWIGACMIAGTDSGECRDYEENRDYMPYCGKFLRYRACVPKYDRIWPNHTILTKDAWVEETVIKIVQERKEHEANQAYKDDNINEWSAEEGEEYRSEGMPVNRFYNNNEEDPDGITYKLTQGQEGTDITDCERSFRQYMCYLNFPRCDDEDKSLILCRSACENLMRACHYQKDMQRCGPSEWVNGVDGPEIPTLDDETGLYDVRIRGFFPGQPFRDYEEECTESINGKECEATVVCTPSLVNKADSVAGFVSLLSAGIFCFFNAAWLFAT